MLAATAKAKALQHAPPSRATIAFLVTAFKLRPGVLDAEDVDDPLVRGVSLLVDAWE
jgi:hypothetical protein